MNTNGGEDSAEGGRRIRDISRLSDHEKRTVRLFRRATPSVVCVTCTVSGGGGRRGTGTGTGFVWDADGHVVTNAHVVAGARDIRVTFADGATHAAALVGVSTAGTDVAVLRLMTDGRPPHQGGGAALLPAPAGGWRALALGSSGDLCVGQSVFALGSPFGLDLTLTTGVVSGLDRELGGGDGQPLRGLVQTDAAINPGNSGGPLLDSGGRVIGVNTAIVSPGGGGSVGVGFALPIDDVKREVAALLRAEHRPRLGIYMAADDTYASLRAAFAEQQQQRQRQRQQQQRRGPRSTLPRGVLVMGVAPGGGAARAGVRGTQRDANTLRRTGNVVLGDVIVAVDGAAVACGADVLAALDGKRAGQAVALSCWRAGEVRTVRVVLGGLVRSKL